MQKAILIVDDQPGIRLLLDDVFTSDGYDVVTAETGKEALEKLQSESVDLLLLDCQLPIINGYEILQWLEEKKITTPAVMMSGLSEDATPRSKQHPNVKKVVGKPFNIQDIRQTVHQVLTG